MAHSFGVTSVMKADVKQTVSRLAEDALSQSGYELADVVVSQYRKRATVRIFVYAENGVTVDDCADLSRLVGDIIDDTDLFADGYTLEVSSPGLDRPLSTMRDYRYRIGETVRVEFTDPKRRRIHGEIVAAGDAHVRVRAEDGIVAFDLADIKQARIVY